jgi:hypothetical protein
MDARAPLRDRRPQSPIKEEKQEELDDPGDMKEEEIDEPGKT